MEDRKFVINRIVLRKYKKLKFFLNGMGLKKYIVGKVLRKKNTKNYYM